MCGADTDRAPAGSGPARPGLSHQKISETEGSFAGTLDDQDLFGTSLASLGDLDGDGVGDLTVGGNRGRRRRLSTWCGCCSSTASPHTPGDMNHDGDINAFDIESFLECLFP